MIVVLDIKHNVHDAYVKSINLARVLLAREPKWRGIR